MGVLAVAPARRSCCCCCSVFLAGPMSQLAFDHPWIDPDYLFGKLLFPFISASVAIILFEGGLSLKRSEPRVHRQGACAISSRSAWRSPGCWARSRLDTCSDSNGR